MRKLIVVVVGLCVGLFIGCELAKANNVNVVCWSGQHLIFNAIVPDYDVDIGKNYVLVNKNHVEHLILGDCVLSRKMSKVKHHHKHKAKKK